MMSPAKTQRHEAWKKKTIFSWRAWRLGERKFLESDLQGYESESF